MRDYLLIASLVLVVSSFVFFASCCSDDTVEWRVRAHEMPRWLSDEECETLKRLATEQGIGRSEVVGQTKPHPSRTSSGTFLKRHHPVVRKVYARASELLGVPENHMEDLQILRYEPGQEYLAHHDSCLDGCDNGKNIDRYATIVMYLNEGFQGGETEFPEQGVAVAPEKGKAVVFFNMTRDKQRVLSESLHRAAPPTTGTKWSAALWIRQTPWS